MKIIGLGHKRRVGKDTVGDLLELKGYERISFAGPLYDICDPIEKFFEGELDDIKSELSEKLALYHEVPFDADEVMNWLEDNYDELSKKQDGKFRNLLQQLGTDKIRERKPTTWADIAERRIKNLYPHNVVITDVRFPNEIEMLRRVNGAAVLVSRPGIERGTESDRHTSEVALDDFEGWDFVIHNDGDFRNLISETERVEEKVWHVEKNMHNA